ncbi:MAG: HU family DNA-binding protein [Desulfovibrionaceae bacterium]
MTKAELINKLYKEHTGELPAKYIVENTYNALCSVMAAELLDGGEVPLLGVGKLKAKKTAIRKGRNPRTGAEITIPAGMRVAFVPFKEMKDALRG